MKPAQWRRQIEQVAAEHGATVETTNGGHLRVKHPSGWFVFQALMNARAQIRRAAREQAQRAEQSHERE